MWIVSLWGKLFVIVRWGDHYNWVFIITVPVRSLEITACDLLVFTAEGPALCKPSHCDSASVPIKQQSYTRSQNSYSTLPDRKLQLHTNKKKVALFLKSLLGKKNRHKKNKVKKKYDNIPKQTFHSLALTTEWLDRHHESCCIQFVVINKLANFFLYSVSKAHTLSSLFAFLTGWISFCVQPSWRWGPVSFIIGYSCRGQASISWLVNRAA